jgi:site-specific DNA-methyltransferase (adenine-specific)
MRADEAPLLRALALKIGAGAVKLESGNDHANPMVLWIVQSREDCWKIADLLDGVPLYAKKQREYNLWRKALEVWTATKRGNRWHGPRDNSAMEKYYQGMKLLRPFDAELAGCNFDPFGQPAYGFQYAWATAALRVAKPGAHLLAFGGTRTFHRLTCAIEDAGWEIRDCLMWVYGSGFPKSHNLKGEWNGWGTALKPAWEPVILARKPLDGTVAENVQKWGTGAINVDGCRVAIRDNLDGRTCGGMFAQRNSDGTLKKAIGSGDKGRWPANLIHDGSEEVLAGFPNTRGQLVSVGPKNGAKKSINTYGNYGPRQQFDPRGDSGSAARFFYCAKASRAEREMGLEGMPIDDKTFRWNKAGEWTNETTKAKNHHPTVKPLALMRYLCRLITPPNGLILDPFVGSGTTGMAAALEGFRFVGIEKEAEYVEIANRRIAAVTKEATQKELAL